MDDKFVHLYVIKTVRKMNDKEKRAWFSFVSVMENFPGNKKAISNGTLVTNLLSAFHDLECNISIKLHFLSGHLDRFPGNLGAVSDKQGDGFHQDLKTMQEHYQGRWDKYMIVKIPTG